MSYLIEKERLERCLQNATHIFVGTDKEFYPAEILDENGKVKENVEFKGIFPMLNGSVLNVVRIYEPSGTEFYDQNI